MKRALIIAVVILLAIALYLNLAYAHIYSSIHAGNLSAPMTTIVEVGGPLTMALPPLRYVALGDSLTAGVGVTTASETFPYQLAEQISKKQGRIVQIINLAAPGATAHDVLIGQLPRVAALKPDVITLIVGVNDVHNRTPYSQFRSDLVRLLQALGTTKARVIVSSVPFVGDTTLFLPPYVTYFRRETQRLTQALWAGAVVPEGVVAVDLFKLTNQPAWRTSLNYSRDHFHLNAAGYKLWADFFMNLTSPQKY